MGTQTDETEGSTATGIKAEDDDVEMKYDVEADKDHKSGDAEPIGISTAAKVEGELEGTQDLAEQSKSVDGHDVVNGEGLSLVASCSRSIQSS